MPTPAIIPHSRGKFNSVRVIITTPLTTEKLAVRTARQLAKRFDPESVRTGDRIGWLTVASDPECYSNRVHGIGCRCSWGCAPINRATGKREYPPQCQRMSEHWYAGCVCSCGQSIRVELTGNPANQWLSCGHHRTPRTYAMVA